MLIYLIDRQKWFTITIEEGKRLLAANLPYFTRSNIQPYLLY